MPRGRGRRRRPTAASSSRCSARWASRPTPARCCACPTGDAIRAGQLLVIGLGSPRHAHARARCAARPGSPRATSRNAASVALALPGRTTPSTCAPWPTGSCSGLYTFTAYKSGRDDTAVAEVADPQRRGPTAGRDRRPRARPATVGDLVRRGPRLGEHARRTTSRPSCSPTASRRWPRSAPGARSPKVEVEVLGARGARGARLRRHPRRRPGLAEPAAPGQAHLGARGPARSASPSSARASPTTPAG